MRIESTREENSKLMNGNLKNDNGFAKEVVKPNQVAIKESKDALDILEEEYGDEEDEL